MVKCNTETFSIFDLTFLFVKTAFSRLHCGCDENPRKFTSNARE
jgi:hypothetical protein